MPSYLRRIRLGNVGCIGRICEGHRSHPCPEVSQYVDYIIQPDAYSSLRSRLRVTWDNHNTEPVTCPITIARFEREWASLTHESVPT